MKKNPKNTDLDFQPKIKTFISLQYGEKKRAETAMASDIELLA